MLRRIDVDGYRSLIGFEVSLNPGINIIVGPNGTGKSNFISFLDFMSEMVGAGLSSAIAASQGAGAVFSQEKFSEDAAELTFSVHGESSEAELKSVDIFGSDEAGLGSISYSYTCKIVYLRSIPAVYIAHERLSVDVSGMSNFAIVRDTDRLEDVFQSRLQFSPNRHPLNTKMFRWIRAEERNIEKSDFVSSMVGAEDSIIRLLASEHAVFAAVLLDLVRYRSINIDPNVARKPSPVGTSGEISPTGEGLASALYRLERGTFFPISGIRWGRPRKSPERQRQIFDQIASWTKEINVSVVTPEVRLDFHEALLRPELVLREGKAISRYPFRRISDGTVKWIALVTILFADDNLSIIEEPENFLHPFMQETFISLCRDIAKDDPRRVLILSTHSPTLLDCCEPSELILFSAERGQTRASLVENRDELASAIKKSRFGLGYFYRIGGVYGADRSVS